MLPICPQLGSINGPVIGRARLHASVPTVKVAGSGYANDATGVKNVRVCLILSSEPTPTPNFPLALFGRHGPVSVTLPHSLMLGVQGKPLLQLVELLNCHPPTR